MSDPYSWICWYGNVLFSDENARKRYADLEGSDVKDYEIKTANRRNIISKIQSYLLSTISDKS